MISSQPHRVLIVDDVPIVRESLRWLLENEPDLTVIGEAANGLEALKRAAELSPDLVILDVELPQLDGYAVTRSLKQLPDAPLVILVSVYDDPLSRQRGLEAGSDGFIEKSTDWAPLIAQIRRALDNRPAKSR